jgi:hypothetical protein
VKQTFSVILLFFFLFNLLGYNLVVLVMRNEIRSGMFAQMERESPEVLFVHKNDPALVWLNSDEIKYKRKRYDIQKLVEKDGMLEIHCYHDPEEEELDNAVEQHMEDHGFEVSKTKHKLKLVYKSLLVFMPEASLEFISVTDRGSLCFVTLSVLLNEIYSDVQVPPPQSAVRELV